MRLLADIRERGSASSVAGKFSWLLARFAVTAIAVGIAAVIGWRLWTYYLEAPWTRDGRVRADVVQVAADVSGLVSDVLVHDNQAVKKGEMMFRIDLARFQIASGIRKPMSMANLLPHRKPNARRTVTTDSMRCQSRTSSNNNAVSRLLRPTRPTSRLSQAATL
jgi:multidrug resistance efflux pump